MEAFMNKPEGAVEELKPEDASLMAMRKESAELIEAIANLTLQKKEIEKQETAMREQLKKAMEKHGVKSFDNGTVRFDYISGTTRTTIDTKRLKKELPSVAKEYQKTSEVAASVKITVKGE